MTYDPSATAPAPVIPYASAMVNPVTSDVWREGKSIVARKNSIFPQRCVKCNVPVDEPAKKRTFYWHSGALFLLILVNILLYAIIALIVRKKGIVEYCICPKHRQQRLIGLLVGWICGVGGVATIIAGGINDSGVAMIAGVVVFIIGIIGALRARMLYPTKIDDYFLWLSGGGPEFLQSLSSVPAPPTLP
jgi:hypothetical protein